jgi:hypothetical protein
VGKADVALAVVIWAALGVAYGPEAWRRWREKPVYPSQTGVIFYTTAGDLQIDTTSCTLPNNSVLLVGK